MAREPDNVLALAPKKVDRMRDHNLLMHTVVANFGLPSNEATCFALPRGVKSETTERVD